MDDYDNERMRYLQKIWMELASIRAMATIAAYALGVIAIAKVIDVFFR